MKKHNYISPEISVIEIEIEDAILTGSGTGSTVVATDIEFGGDLW